MDALDSGREVGWEQMAEVPGLLAAGLTSAGFTAEATGGMAAEAGGEEEESGTLTGEAATSSGGGGAGAGGGLTDSVVFSVEESSGTKGSEKKRLIGLTWRETVQISTQIHDRPSS